MTPSTKNLVWPAVFLAIGVIGNFIVWAQMRDVQGRWANVPPVMSQGAAIGSGLGDPQFAYRSVAVMLQHLGDHGGRATPLKQYDYQRLSDWFMLTHQLDSESDFAPFLAAFYFGALQEDKVRPLLEYLKTAGNSPVGQKWRWLAQGVFIAQYHVKDQQLALELAQVMAQIPNPDMPAWARAMPGFVMADMGKEEAAFALMISLLQSDAQNLHPAEVRYLTDYICDNLIPEAQRADHALCAARP